MPLLPVTTKIICIKPNSLYIGTIGEIIGHRRKLDFESGDSTTHFYLVRWPDLSEAAYQCRWIRPAPKNLEEFCVPSDHDRTKRYLVPSSYQSFNTPCEVSNN